MQVRHKRVALVFSHSLLQILFWAFFFLSCFLSLYVFCILEWLVYDGSPSTGVCTPGDINVVGTFPLFWLSYVCDWHLPSLSFLSFWCSHYQIFLTCPLPYAGITQKLCVVLFSFVFFKQHFLISFYLCFQWQRPMWQQWFCREWCCVLLRLQLWMGRCEGC